MTKPFGALLMVSSAMTVLAAMSAPAFAQAPAPAQPSGNASVLQEVVVTGTSIRGVAPVGSSVISVGQEAIQKTAAQSVQQILQNVPAVVGLGSAGQGSFGSADGAGTDAPTIHGLGASASNSTLILIDGHRLPLSGLNHALADPNILPPMALQRVEVLADGASSIYGSDAVAGVVNFITRRNYNGFEASAQAGFGDHYRTYQAGFVGGKTWEGGSGLVAYGYSNRSALLAGDRSFTHANHTSQGGTNLASFACGVATIQAAGSSLQYVYPYGSGVANTQANRPCDYTGLADLLPSDVRNSLMAKVTQKVTDKLTLSADAVYSNRYSVQRNVRGTVTATVFGPGAASTSQINPFFTLPPGVTATSETVAWDANALLGPGAHTNSSEETFYATGGAQYNLTENWRLGANVLIGANTSRQSIIGAVNGSVANLGLNGTTNGGGSLTAASVPATGLIVLGTPLTTANALDVWNLGSANRTSAAELARLTDSTQTRVTRHNLADVTAKLDGTLFMLPAGPVRIAVGGEYIRYTIHQDIAVPLNIGPASLGSSTTSLDYNRSVQSGYGELLVPIVSPEQTIPLVHRLDLSISGRYDHYSDFGNTSNPKFGANWEVIEGLKFRANYAQSFVAPALTSRGVPTGPWGITGESSLGGGPTNLSISTATYPQALQLPGCAGLATCVIGTTSIQGLQINGGNKDLRPQLGKSWAFGGDYSPTFVPGLRLSATWWHNEIAGAITAPTAALAVNAAGLNSLLTIFPTGATQSQITALAAGLPLQTTIPSTTYFIYNFQQRNALNLWVEGIDFDASYSFHTSVGRFDLQTGGSYKTRFDQQVGAGGAIFSVLNTTGFNTTFPSIQFEMRSGATWTSNYGLAVNLAWSHTGSYKNWGASPLNPITKSAQGIPTGGGDTVAANDTFDGHVAYDFQNKAGWASGLQVYVDVQNMFDKAPPFYNVAAGYDNFAANPIGRVVSVGARKKF